MQHIFNLKESKLDGSESRFDHAKYAAQEQPASFDLRPKCPPVYDQGNEGSCTANAGCAALAMLWAAEALKAGLITAEEFLMFSRAFQYFMERLIEGTTSEDSGASMKDIGVAQQEYGCCLDAIMPYTAGDYTTAPTDADKASALVYKISGASMVRGIDGIKTALVSRSQPVLCGMTVYDSMESEQTAATGVLPMPKENEQILGGHAVLIVGYTPVLPKSALEKVHPFLVSRFAEQFQREECIEKVIEAVIEHFTKRRASGYFIVRNSWGASWGDAGYFYMPYEYVSKQFANEFWILEK